MIENRQNYQTADCAELLDMRTHLTVAMLAAAQLQRKTKHLPEAEHLQCYLDQSLKSLVEDVGKVDELVMQVAEPAPVPAPPRHRWPRPLVWLAGSVKWMATAACGWLHRKQYRRLTLLYVPR